MGKSVRLPCALTRAAQKGKRQRLRRKSVRGWMRLTAPRSPTPHGHGSGSEYSEPSTQSPDSQNSAPSARPKKQKHSGEKSSSRYLTRLKKIPSPEDYLRGVSLAIAILRPEMALESFFLHFVGRSSQKKKSPGKGAFWRFFLL